MIENLIKIKCALVTSCRTKTTASYLPVFRFVETCFPKGRPKIPFGKIVLQHILYTSRLCLGRHRFPSRPNLASCASI